MSRCLGFQTKCTIVVPLFIGSPSTPSGPSQRMRAILFPFNAGTAEPFRVSPPEAVVYYKGNQGIYPINRKPEAVLRPIIIPQDAVVEASVHRGLDNPRFFLQSPARICSSQGSICATRLLRITKSHRGSNFFHPAEYAR